MPKPFNFIKPDTNLVYYDVDSAKTTFLKVPTGTTAQRPSSALPGMIRYNTTINAFEYYVTDWVQLTGLGITSVSPTSYNGANTSTFTITGSGFVAGTSVKFITNTGTAYTAATVTINNLTSITATTPRAFTVSEEPLDVQVVSPFGVTATLQDVIDCGGSPTWSTAAGSLGNIYDIQRTTKTFTLVATDPDASATISYSLTSGSLPTGMSLNSSTGVISGTASAVVSDTTFNFDVTATDNAGNTATRSFSITSKAPIVTSYTATGATSFSVPTGLNLVNILVVAGGGAGGGGIGGAGSGGGGGAGGVVYATSYPVTPGGSVPINVGTGGSSVGVSPGQSDGRGGSGSNSAFGPITAVGGGGGGGGNGAGVNLGLPGGSGGGGGPSNKGAPYDGGPGTQPSQNPGVSNLTNYGSAGGSGGGTATGGGGGGAGGIGGSAAPGPNTNYGGVGISNSITGSPVYYGGGGGGGQWTSVPSTGGGTGGNGGGGNGGANNGSPAGISGTVNTGGGGGGGGENPSPAVQAGNGGPGIVIVKY